MMKVKNNKNHSTSDTEFGSETALSIKARKKAAREQKKKK